MTDRVPENGADDGRNAATEAAGSPTEAEAPHKATSTTWRELRETIRRPVQDGERRQSRIALLAVLVPSATLYVYLLSQSKPSYTSAAAVLLDALIFISGLIFVGGLLAALVSKSRPLAMACALASITPSVVLLSSIPLLSTPTP